MLPDLIIEPQSIIAGFAAIAAWVAALFAYKMYSIAQKTLELAEIEKNEKKSHITAYLADSFSLYENHTKQKKYIFSIAYSNKSENIDSIAEVLLETFYVNSKDRVNHLITAHEQDSGKWLAGNAKPAQLPISIQARSSVTNWFVFSVPPIAQNSKRIQKYRVVARNSQGAEASVESYLLKEIECEEKS